MPDIRPGVDIAMIGHMAKDRLVYRGRTEISPGGAVYYGGIALRQIGLQVAVVTRLSQGDFSLLEELKQAGILV